MDGYYANLKIKNLAQYQGVGEFSPAVIHKYIDELKRVSIAWISPTGYLNWVLSLSKEHCREDVNSSLSARGCVSKTGMNTPLTILR
jgi:hypothetical protein